MGARKHTPGPWGRNIPPIRKYSTIYAGRNTHIARVVSGQVPDDQAEANAALIAAAPALYEALEKIAAGDGCYGLQAHEYKMIAREALAQIKEPK